MLKYFGRFLVVVLVLCVVGASGALYALWHFGRDLPDYRQLATYEPPTMTRVHAGDGRLLAEFATEKRVFVPIDAIPKHVIAAFLASEDAEFYTHPGVNILSVFRAALQNVEHYASDKRPVGASTITQQVAKNFLLSNELSLSRKVKEAILAFRLDRTYSKDRILELYLNEIYLGYGSYGVAAAALNYFNKSLAELSVGEAAYLAALPKAPNNYHPVRHAAAALARRNWVIDRMREEHFISSAQASAAEAEPLTIRTRDEEEVARADYFAEEVRRDLVQRFGEEALYRGGLSVKTSLDPRLQVIADNALRAGLRGYDRRHGWRGPIAHIDAGEGWQARLAGVSAPPGLAPWRLAVVLGVEADKAAIGLTDGSRGHIPLQEMTWARAHRPEQEVGPGIKAPSDVLKAGDVVAVERVKGEESAYALRQIPSVQGAVVAMDPHTGRVLAMSGGYSQEMSVFNRATQAKRQPGSSFKPFVYLAGLDSGFTPATRILDAPIVIDQGPGLGKWKPENYTGKFYGPAPMRVGIEQSRNLMTVRLAENIGMDKVAAYAKQFGIVDDMPEVLSMALGAGETTLLRLTTAYAMLVNGGKRITPSLIDRVQDRQGRTIFRQDTRDCTDCRPGEWRGNATPELPDLREQIADPISVYQIVSMLEGVIARGTGQRIRELNRTLAGKTGTTNDSADTWFVGFSPDLVFGVFVGFDQPMTLGGHETGASVAVPIFKDFMAAALVGKPDIPFRIPPGVRLVHINLATGLPAKPGDKNVILEAFRPGTVPTEAGHVLDGGDEAASGGVVPLTGSGGLY
ncbi:MAG: penicillin-binding protein 1A [Alphaproteobacteria bacterium]